MSYELNIEKQVLFFNEQAFTANELRASESKASSFSFYTRENFGPESFENSLAMFLQEWFNDNPYIKVKTSGSTGTPKEMLVEKARMMNSARLTLSFLGIKTQDSALLCMPLDYIAGKMLVVRALVGKLKLICVSPGSNPLAQIDKLGNINFAAMIPMQVITALKDKTSAQALKNIDNLIIGGGAIDQALGQELKGFSKAVWSTYGMTETLSHIALRRLSGAQASDWYCAFDSVHVYLSDQGTLRINAPLVNSNILSTNDIVEFNEQGQFRILGRLDNVINSGGVKLQIEQIEQWLSEKQQKLSHEYEPLKTCSLLISSREDHQFGQIVVLLYASNQQLNEYDFAPLFEGIPKYWKPKAIVKVDAIPLTGTNKPDRAKAKKLASGN